MKTCPIYIASSLYPDLKRIAKELNRSVAELVNEVLSETIRQYDDEKIRRRASQME